MKQILLLTFIYLNWGCATTKNNLKVSYILNGTWIPIKQEIGGKDLPPVVFQKQKLFIADSTYTLTAESVDKGTLKCNGGKIDIYGKEGVNKGKHFTAIYKTDHEQLTICYNLIGDFYPMSFETKSAPTLFLSVFKKQ